MLKAVILVRPCQCKAELQAEAPVDPDLECRDHQLPWVRRALILIGAARSLVILENGVSMLCSGPKHSFNREQSIQLLNKAGGVATEDELNQINPEFLSPEEVKKYVSIFGLEVLVFGAYTPCAD